MRAFASDNYAGIHPEALAALAEANQDHAVAYGDDPWTARAEELLREHFGRDARPFLVFNGTGANVLALLACCRPWEAVLTPRTSHLHVDEAGAPERLAGLKLLTVAGHDGKLGPEDVLGALDRVGDQHAVQPRVVSVANATELGTVYDLGELRALADAAHGAGMLLHVDGARLANAAAALDASLAELTGAVGTDVVSFGATKNGAFGVEAVVFLRPGLGEGFAWLRKQHAQLSSKMRFAAAQVVALLEDDLWRRSAAHANAMAMRLAAAVGDVPGVRLTRPVQANAVFAVLPPDAAERARRRVPFYTWDERTGEVRWMCSWDTTPEDVDAFAEVVREAVAAERSAA
jgi:threonine aldolase